MFTNFGRDIVFSADLCYNEATPQGSILYAPETKKRDFLKRRKYSPGNNNQMFENRANMWSPQIVKIVQNI